MITETLRFLYLYFVAVCQIGLGGFLVIYVRHNIKQKTQYILLGLIIILSAANIIIFLLPIKYNIDEKNNCIAFYRAFPDYGFQEEDYKLTWLERCDAIYGDKLDLLRKSGRDLAIHKLQVNIQNKYYLNTTILQDITWESGNLS